VGDEIFGTKRIGWFRRYVKTRVLAYWSSIKPAYRVTLEDGTTLVCSGDHRFLTERGWKHVTGTECGATRRPHLTTGNKLMGTGSFAEGPLASDDYRQGYLCGVIRGDGLLKSYAYPREGRVARIHSFRLALCDAQALLRAQDYLLDFEIATHEHEFCASAGARRAMHSIRAGSLAKVESIRQLIRWPTEPTREWSAGFLAGIFDAEGSFSQGALRIPNTDPQIIGWIGACMRLFGFGFVLERRREVGRKPMEIVRLAGGLKEQLRFFHSIRPAITRKLDIEGLALKSSARLGVASIEPLGKAMRLHDITTGTGDFIANGVVSHNCYARPSHAYLGLSPGLDFETRLFAKENAAELLREELRRPGYQCEPIMLGANTDCYQPIERKHRVTRSVLEVLAQCLHPAAIVTKSALVERDLDLLVPMAREALVGVTISVTTLDHDLARTLEPRASAPRRRIEAIRALAAAGVPVGVNVAPVIPFLTDAELYSILEEAARAGASFAGYTLLRLPWEVRDLFKAWLEQNVPLKAAHVMARVRDMRGGRENDPNFGSRMHGQGELSRLLSQRFRKACARLGIAGAPPELDWRRFVPPAPEGQATLF
jgi:DNA repair photolyase